MFFSSLTNLVVEYHRGTLGSYMGYSAPQKRPSLLLRTLRNTRIEPLYNPYRTPYNTPDPRTP